MGPACHKAYKKYRLYMKYKTSTVKMEEKETLLQQITKNKAKSTLFGIVNSVDMQY